MRYACLRFVAAVLVGMSCIAVAAAPAFTSSGRRPNIVLIMADDMGYSDIGCYGSEIATPHLDRLAAEGLRFTQFYNNARCCPTRAALLTGLYPHQAGMGGMVSMGDRAGPSPYQGFLSDRCVTLAEVLRTAGYCTYMSGKWHVGEKRPNWPTDRGFERYFGLISGASNYFVLDQSRAMAKDDQPFVPDDPTFYMTDAFSKAAVNFIEQHAKSKADEPFFLYLSYTAPHWPLHAWPEDIAKYRGKYKQGWDELRKQRHQRMIEMGIVEAAWPLSPRDPKSPPWDKVSVEDQDDFDLRMAVYAAQIDRMDQGIGTVLAAIRRAGVEENTLIMFLSDNGGCAEEVRRTKGVPAGGKESFLSYGQAWANASNTPYRMYKHFAHEGGIGTPFIAHWPAVIRESGKTTPQVGHIIDVMATCLDAAGSRYPSLYRDTIITPLEGKSLLPVFEGKIRAGHEVLYWEHMGNRAVRKGDWKLVALADQPWELYDLAADRTELHDVAAKHPDRVSELADLYEAWAQRLGVQKRRPKPGK